MTKARVITVNVATDTAMSYSIDNVVSITYSEGELYIIHKEDGQLYSLSYSRKSLGEGSVVIS